MQTNLTKELINQAICRLYDESLPRMIKCVEEVSDEELWHRHNQNCNSIGNLVLHLTGNVNQWINTGLGGDKDDRERQAEFDNRGEISRVEMVARLNAVMERAKEVLKGMQENTLLSLHSVQGFEETGVSIVIHVVEHFSYHVGQITYIVKFLKEIDTGYYQDDDLNIIGQE